MNLMLKLILLVALTATPVFAGEYKITIVQQGANLFKMSDQDTYIWTSYCFVDVGTSEALLSIQGSSGKIRFSNNETSCDVQMLYGKSSLAADEYRIVVTRADDNWYTVDGKEAALLTGSCLASAEGTEIRLIVEEDGTGTLKFEDEECSLEGIYTPVTEQL